MPNIIKDGKIQKDNWLSLQDEKDLQTIPEGDLLVSTGTWQENRDQLLASGNNLGLFLGSDEAAESIIDDLPHFQLIAINFPAFTDGRGYSIARLLRERYGYQGDIRAVGDVLHDQLFYMHRCGFSSYAIKEGKDIEEALAGLNTIGDAYQAAVDQPNPLYRRRA